MTTSTARARAASKLLAAACALLACAPPQGGRATVDAPASVAAGTLTAGQARWVERTLASLTLRQKAGQLVMPWISGAYAAEDSDEMARLLELVERDGVGGVVVSMGMPLSYAAKLNALQRRARVPLLVASDMESGPGMRMAGIYSFPHLLPQGGGTDFPPAMAFGAAGSDTLAYEAGRALAREARAVGVHVTFGPVLDVNSNPANPIISTRSFGEDPALVARLAGAFSRGAREGGLQTTAKHFPGHGDTEADSHIELPVVRGDRARLDAVELATYRALLPAGVDGVMSAHIAAVGVEGADAPPATLSPYFLTRVLREELGFRGIVYTDAMDMGAVVRRYGEADALERALAAGADVLLMPRDPTDAVDAVEAAVRAGRLSEARLDRSVRLVLEAKARAGLAERRDVPLEAVARQAGIAAHAGLARRVAARSITLPRDTRAMVPLAGSVRRLLVVVYADAADPIAGRVFAAALAAPDRTVEVARVDARTTVAELAQLRRRADSADATIAAAFVAPLEGRGTVQARGGFADWVESLAAAGAPVGVVSFGSPYLLAAFPSVGTYLLAWGGADASQLAAADALLGRAPITGRLPVSIPPLHRRGEGRTVAAR